jgi:peptidylprolyl isomerase
MDVPGGRVIIELAPDFAPNLAANVRALTRHSYFDGAAIIRTQDNYVVQWGRHEDDPMPLGPVGETLAPEFDRASAGLGFTSLPDPDTYAPEVGFVDGFPAARGEGRAWLTHCYAMVGAGRGMAPESGNGVSLYVVTGQSPRHLDRNVVLVGRVIQGMEHLSSLPRGTGPLGFYETAAEAAPIARMRVAADLPEADRERIEVLRTDTSTFTALVESRRNRRDDWFVRPAGRIEVCNVPLPVRAR